MESASPNELFASGWREVSMKRTNSLFEIQRSNGFPNKLQRQANSAFTIFLLYIGLAIGFRYSFDTPAYASGSQSQLTENSFQLAVMTCDHLVLPIAVYHSREWHKCWPGFEQVDISVDHPPDLKMPSSMYFQTRAGDSETIQLLQPGIVTNCADASWVYFTNRSVTPKPFTGENLDIAGKYICLATNKKINVLFDRALDISSPIFDQIKNAICSHLSNLEDKELEEKAKSTGSENGFIKGRGYPLSRASRDSIIPEITVFEAPLSVSGIRAFNFIARKKYPYSLPKTNVQCSDFVQYSGWVILNKDSQPIIVDREIRLSDCDTETFGWECLGCFELDDRIFWVGHVMYYESELFELYEIFPRTVSKLMEVSGGGC